MTSRLSALLLILLDLLACVVVFNLISAARGITDTGHFIITPLAAPVLAFIAAVYLVQGYRLRTDMLSIDYASQHVIATIGATITTLMLTYVVMPSGYELQSSRFVIALSFVALVPLTLGYRRLIYLRAIAAGRSRTVVFVGDHTSWKSFRAECAALGTSQPIVYSVVEPLVGDSVRPDGDDSGTPFRLVLEQIETNAIEVEAIVLRESAHALPAEMSQKLVQLYFAGVPTYSLELFHELYWQKIPLYRLNQTWLFQEGFKIAREPVFERIKRITDVMLATTGLVLSAPLILLSAIAIWINDRGPIIFPQTRIGRNHRPFVAYKLRSMRAVPNGDRYTRAGDTRITKVGKFLRSTRLDEIPQLWNVLRGDMSIIGPRAEWDELVAEYERQIPCYYFRHLVRPGITGWAQVNYPYGASLDDTLRKLEYDLYYIRHFSLRLDATIVLKTIHVMLFGKGR